MILADRVTAAALLEWAADNGVSLVVGRWSTHVHAVDLDTIERGWPTLCARRRAHNYRSGRGLEQGVTEASIAVLATWPPCQECRTRAERRTALR